MAIFRHRKQGGREVGGPASEQLTTVLDPSGLASEAYRTLGTNLLYSSVDDPPKVILITSPGAQEGKSTSCANLGVVLAQADKTTLIVDGDLRRPSMHKIFSLRNFRGVANVLTGAHDLSEVWGEPLPKLKIVPTGPLPPNPMELLNSNRFAELIAKARQQFDYVLIDSPPVELVSDPLILATHTDGVLLILDSQRTRKRSLRNAVRNLNTVGANVLGTVMTNVEKTPGGYYTQSYTY